MNSKRNLDRRGLTLTELMITLSIFGIIMAVVMGFVTGARNSYTDTRARAQYQQSMRAVLSMMTREIRSAGCDPAGAAFDATCDAVRSAIHPQTATVADLLCRDLSSRGILLRNADAGMAEPIRFDRC